MQTFGVVASIGQGGSGSGSGASLSFLLPLITGAGSLLGALFAYFILPVWVAYILNDKNTLVATFDKSLPKAWRFDTWAVIKTVERDFGQWVRGQILLGFAVGIATFVGLIVLSNLIDPIFGRAGEEIEACAAAGIEVEVIPGVTSAQAAAARLGVSLTHRDHARRVQFITGHDRHGKVPADLDWDAIADPNATTIVYMPLRTLRELTAKVLALGLPPGTPAVAIANATRNDERAVSSTIGPRDVLIRRAVGFI